MCPFHSSRRCLHSVARYWRPTSLRSYALNRMACCSYCALYPRGPEESTSIKLRYDHSGCRQRREASAIGNAPVHRERPESRLQGCTSTGTVDNRRTRQGEKSSRWSIALSWPPLVCGSGCKNSISSAKKGLVQARQSRSGIVQAGTACKVDPRECLSHVGPPGPTP